jgi:hypothetical protein
MPNNCNSIIKNTFYILIVCVAASCVSMKNNNNSLTYNGKFILNHNNIDQSSFNINISLVNKETIIQITKPFYGNVLKIKFNKEEGLILLPTKFTEQFYISDEINRNFKYWLRQCLLSKDIVINEIYDDTYFNFNCITKNDKTSFEIVYNKFLINGFVKRK